jgi:hypothetical protein
MMKGGVTDKPINYMMFIGVHSTVHPVYPNECHVTTMNVSVCVCVCVCV